MGHAMQADRSDERIAAVITFYRNDATFPQALASVLAQTRPADEIVVVDDASPPGCDATLQGLDPRVRVLRHTQNSGPDRARQTGVDATSSELIVFLDGDDTWLPQKLEKQHAFLHSHPDFDAVHTALIEFHQDGSERLFDAKPETIDLAESLRINHVMSSSLMVRRTALDAVGGWSISRNITGDHDLNIRMVAAGQRIRFLADPMVRFRRCGQGNFSSKRWRQMRRNLGLVRKHRKLYLRTLGVRGTMAVSGRYIAELGRDPGWLGRCGRAVGYTLGHREKRPARPA